MPTTIAKDRFDDVPEDLERVGAHRAPKPRGRGWIVFAWAALACGALVALGVLAMFLINDRVSFSSATQTTTTTSSAPTVAPTVDPETNIVLLNGTGVDGLASQASDALTAEGWTVQTADDAARSDYTQTTVYYSEAGQEGAAHGLAAALGDVPVEQSDRFAVEDQSRLVAVLGSDYAPAE